MAAKGSTLGRHAVVTLDSDKTIPRSVTESTIKSTYSGLIYIIFYLAPHMVFLKILTEGRINCIGNGQGKLAMIGLSEFEPDHQGDRAWIIAIWAAAGCGYQPSA